MVEDEFWKEVLEEYDESPPDFSSVEDPYSELYSFGDMDVEEFYAASTVLAFLTYSNEVFQNPEFEDKLLKAVEGIERFLERGVISGLDFLYSREYGRRVERRLQERNINREVASSEFEDRKVEDSEEFTEFEKRLVEALLGRDRN